MALTLGVRRLCPWRPLRCHDTHRGARWLLARADSGAQVAMQALRIDINGKEQGVSFSAVEILLSIPFGCISTSLGLWIRRNDNRQTLMYNPVRVLLAGTCMAVGVGILHYVGVMSMCGPFSLFFPWWMVGRWTSRPAPRARPRHVQH